MQTPLCEDVVSFDTSSFAYTPPPPPRTSAVTDPLFGLGHDPLGFEDTLLSDTGGDDSNHSYEQAAADLRRAPPLPKAQPLETPVVKSENAIDVGDDWLDVFGRDLELPLVGPASGPASGPAPAPPVPPVAPLPTYTIDSKSPVNVKAKHASTGASARTNSGDTTSSQGPSRHTSDSSCTQDCPATAVTMPASSEFEQSLWDLGLQGPDQFQVNLLAQDTQNTHVGHGFTGAPEPQMTVAAPAGAPGCSHSPRSDTGSAVSDPASGSAASDTAFARQHGQQQQQQPTTEKPTKSTKSRKSTVEGTSKPQTKRGVKLDSKYDWDEHLLMMPRAEFVRFTRTNKHLTRDQLNDLRQTRRRMKNRLYQKDARDRRFIRVARERELTRHQLQASVRRLSARCVRLEAIIREHCPEQLTLLSQEQL